jgi:hypothetical protein
MWTHFCPVEKALLAVEDGEPCNWKESIMPNEQLAIAIIRGGRSFTEAAELSGLPVGFVVELWSATKSTGPASGAGGASKPTFPLAAAQCCPSH